MSKEWKHLLKFRCTCCANCCREPIVLVTDEDVRRVADHTGQVASEILKFYRPDDIEWSTDKPEWIKLKSGLRIMGLRRNKSGCQYLGEDDLCTIYEHRPVTCRRYPFDVELDEDGEIDSISISTSVECPYELDGCTSLSQLNAVCAWEEKEETPYFAKVKNWNRKGKPGGKKAFLQHLGLQP